MKKLEQWIVKNNGLFFILMLISPIFIYFLFSIELETREINDCKVENVILSNINGSSRRYIILTNKGKFDFFCYSNDETILYLKEGNEYDMVVKDILFYENDRLESFE